METDPMALLDPVRLAWLAITPVVYIVERRWFRPLWGLWRGRYTRRAILGRLATIERR